MRIKVDEDLPVAITRLLRGAGHDLLSIRDQGMGGWKDPGLWPAVQEEGRLLITADKGFADLREHPPGTHHGIVLLRPDEDGIRPLVELIHQLLADRPLHSFARTVASVTPRGVRVRRSP